MTHLCNGTPNGTRTVEFSNRLIKGIVIPRNELKNIGVKLIDNSGVYFLIGETEREDLVVYIGQAMNLKNRLLQHNSTKEFWNFVVAFTYKDCSLTESDINYLEKELIDLAKKVGRYKVQNVNNGNKWGIQDYRIPDMLEFIDDTKILLANLWVFVLKEFINKSIAQEDLTKYYLKGEKFKGEWFYTDEWFLVLKWSKGPKNLALSQTTHKLYAFRNRPKLSELSVIKEDWESIVFLKDYLFSSPSSAATILMWRNANGRTEWKTKWWKTLHEIERISE